MERWKIAEDVCFEILNTEKHTLNLKTKDKSLKALDDNEFKLRIIRNNKLQIKNDSLGEDWWTVCNIAANCIEDIVLESTMKCGEASETFEAIFKIENNKEVSFIHSKMSKYKDCMNEMIRELNFNLHKKTSKRIIGHKYDTADQTYYYISDIYSNKSNELAGIFLKEDSVKKYIVHFGKLEDENISISDLLENYEWEIVDKLPGPAVDLGLVLDTSRKLEDIEDLLSSRIRKSKDSIFCENNVLELASIKSFDGVNEIKLSDKSLKEFSDYVVSKFMNYLLIVKVNNLVDLKYESLYETFLANIDNINSLKMQYYRELFHYYDISSQLQVAFKEFDQYLKYLRTNFDIYLDFYKRCRHFYNNDSIFICIPATKTKLKSRINEAITNSKLQKIIYSILCDLKDNILVKGLKCSNWEKKQEVTIDLLCLLQYKGIIEGDESLKSELVNMMFNKIVIHFENIDKVIYETA